MINKKIIDQYKDCKLCTGCLTETKVYGSGNLKAEIAVVGEGPGKDEVTQGQPFVGAAGQLLNKILAAVDLKREDLYFTNAVLCRTDDKNRTPTKLEYSNCRKRLFDELFIVKPHVTLLVGSIACKTVLGDDFAIMKDHGQWRTGLSMPCYFYFTIFHPAWILHSDTEGEKKLRKQIMWKDIKEFKEGIGVFNDTINWGTIDDEIKRERREGTIGQVLPT
jgi:DNA polymerase